VGKPNAGKSTLLNTLLNENRAIVSEIAGTTRDTIEETLNIDGILFRLVDTAGIREHTSDLVEKIGVERSLEKIRQADIVVYMFDVEDEVGEVYGKVREMSEADLEMIKAGDASSDEGAAGDAGDAGGAAVIPQRKRFLWVGNKVDRMDDEGRVEASGDGTARDVIDADVAIDVEDAARRKFSLLPNAIYISAKRHLHIDVLRERLVDQVLQGNTAGAGAEGTIVTNARHYHALKLVAEGLRTIRNGLDGGVPGDLLALDIRHCLHYLGEITGEITTEDRLDYIFSKFCIGK
jgi:tRNA modification GTPase